jgi:hypothetical protein
MPRSRKLSEIKTKIGAILVERYRRFKHSPISHVIVRVTFNDPNGDPDMVKSLSATDYKISKRSEITLAYVEGKVAEMLDRDDLDGLTLRSVDVNAVENVWLTPYDLIYPKED